MEVKAEIPGTITALMAEEGDTVTVAQDILQMEEGEAFEVEAAAPAAAAATAAAAAPAAGAHNQRTLPYAKRKACFAHRAATAAFSRLT